MDRGQIVKNAYDKKHVSGKCEICGSTDWGITDDLRYLTFSSADAEGRLDGLTQMPVVVLTCNNCGNVRIHSLRVLVS